MPNEIFTDPGDATDEWADVRLTEPEAGEWDVDFVVAGGQVEYADLRVRPKHLTAFLTCLIDDVDEDRAGTILSDIAARKGIDLREHVGEE